LSQDTLPQAAVGPGDSEGAKERIVHAAVRLFCEKGFDATPVREICDAAGVTKPVLYYYFKNKEDLFQSILRDTLGEFRRNLVEACNRQNGDLRKQLDEITEVYVNAAKSNPDLVRFINSIAFSGLYEKLFNFHDYWLGNMEMFHDLFARAQERGLVRSDVSAQTLAFHFSGVVLSLMRGLVYFPELVGDYPLKEGIAGFVLEGIAETGNR
jgi:AcrR family transcriptional regulator